MNRQLDLLARGKLDASSAAGQLSLTLSALLDEDPPLRKVLLVAVGKKDGSMDAKTDSSDGEWTKHTSKSGISYMKHSKTGEIKKLETAEVSNNNEKEDNKANDEQKLKRLQEARKKYGASGGEYKAVLAEDGPKEPDAASVLTSLLEPGAEEEEDPMRKLMETVEEKQ